MLLTPRLYGMGVHLGQIIGETVWKPIISPRLNYVLSDAKDEVAYAAEFFRWFY